MVPCFHAPPSCLVVPKVAGGEGLVGHHSTSIRAGLSPGRQCRLFIRMTVPTLILIWNPGRLSSPVNKLCSWLVRCVGWVGGASQLLRVKSFVDTRQSPRGSAHHPPPTAYEASESVLKNKWRPRYYLCVENCEGEYTSHRETYEVQWQCWQYWQYLAILWQCWQSFCQRVRCSVFVCTLDNLIHERAWGWLALGLALL